MLVSISPLRDAT